MSVVYEINRGINSTIEFRGLKAQYIVYFLVGLVGLLVLYAVTYIAGVPTFVGLGGTAILAFILYSQVYRYSNKYGEHGLMKEAAFRQVPSAIRCRNREIFLALNASKSNQHDNGTDPGNRATIGTISHPER